MNRLQGESNNRIPALVLMGLGAFFLFTRIFSFDIGTLWPLFVILPGLPFLYAALTGQKKDSGLIFPGVIITGTGLLLMVQSITGNWESWAYAWAFYPIFVGIALTYQGRKTGNESEVRTGRGMMTYGSMALVILWVLFEVFIFGNFLGGISGWLIPAVMIGGGWLLLNRGKSQNQTVEPVVKAKNMETDSYKSKNGEGGVAVNEELRRRIDEALAE